MTLKGLTSFKAIKKSKSDHGEGVGKHKCSCVFSIAKCFPISHHLLLMYRIILEDCFCSVTDPALGINHPNHRSHALMSDISVKVTHLFPIASTFLAFSCSLNISRRHCVKVCVPPRGPEKVKQLHGEREANRVNCYVKSATVNCGPGRPPFSLPVPGGIQAQMAFSWRL